MITRMTPVNQFVVRLAAALSLLVYTGCSRSGGISDVERQKQEIQNRAGSIEQMGGKMVEKTYPLGKAWAVDLSGVQLADNTFDLLRQVGYISELNLSKTNVTDEQLANINDFAATILKLDLSRTGITDAGLAKLTNLRNCREINLVGSKVTRAGVDAYNRNAPTKQTAIRLK